MTAAQWAVPMAAQARAALGQTADARFPLAGAWCFRPAARISRRLATPCLPFEIAERPAPGMVAELVTAQYGCLAQRVAEGGYVAAGLALWDFVRQLALGCAYLAVPLYIQDEGAVHSFVP